MILNMVTNGFNSFYTIPWVDAGLERLFYLAEHGQSSRSPFILLLNQSYFDGKDIQWAQEALVAADSLASAPWLISWGTTLTQQLGSPKCSPGTQSNVREHHFSRWREEEKPLRMNSSSAHLQR